MAVRWAFLKRVLAGAVLGVYMAELLYFLNPQVDVTPSRVALVTMLYALICGVAFGAVLWALRALRVRFIGKPDTDGAYRAHGFGFVVLAAFTSAAIYWMQRLVFFIYLPIGAQRALAKATNLITVIAFVLLLLWVAERSASRHQSRVIFIIGVLLIAISAVVIYQGLERYRSEPQRVVVANVGTVAGRRPMLVVTVRHLSYDWIVTLAGEGVLPFFDDARSHAYFTRLEPFPTTGTEALWASLATGKLPFRTGVTGAFAYASLLNGFDRRQPVLVLPSGIGFQPWQLIPPVYRLSSQLPSGAALPLWALFDRVGIHATVINWPNEPRQNALPPRTLPPAIVARFRGAGDASNRVVRALGADMAAVEAARIAAANSPVTIVSLRGFEDAQRAIHIFNNDLPPRSAVKGEIARAYAAEIDAMLSSLAHDFPDHLIVVTAPSAAVAPKLPATPFALIRDFVIADDPGADDGFVLMRGPGVAHRERVAPAQTVDVVPTCLYASGLPVGRDMDGRVLSDAFTDEVLRANALTLVQTYEAQQLLVRRGGS
jgi:hypothetical protein